MIRSTITRPTTIAATSSCDRKVNLIESVDVGLLSPPKPRTISLEPISRRTRRSKQKSKEAESVPDSRVPSEVPSSTKRSESPVPDESASQIGSVDPSSGPRSPLTSDGRSEVSAESVVSSSTGMSFRLGPAPSSRATKSSKQSNDSSQAKTITATIELLKGGALPGDNIPLKVSIQHTKRIKSMHGIIITLYRQGRIDSAPPLDMFKDLTGKAAEKMKHEEYYPKSKTGLGGLSLSSAGTSSVFRKDLSQTFAPIIIDPTTLSTVVTASIRVPEDVFPTITGAPGQMISFRYHIEVVVDLGGKLAGQERHVPRLGMINVPSNFVSAGNVAVEREGGSGNMLATWGGSIVETEHIRREKSVVACLFELVVGTTDSQRHRARGNTLSRSHTNEITIVATSNSQTFTHTDDPEGAGHEDEGFNAEQSYHHDGSQYPVQSTFDDRPPYEPSQYHSYHAPQNLSLQQEHMEGQPEPYQVPRITVPDAQVEAEESMTEKERIRQAEQRLLPSQPPEDEAGPSTIRDHAPSAPAFLGDELDVPDYMEATSRVATPSPPNGSSAPTEEGPSMVSALPATSNEPSAPPMGDLPPNDASNSMQAVAEHGETQPAPTDDKQELERRRLMAETSSPADFPDEEGNGEGSNSAHVASAPSAPILIEEDEFGYSSRYEADASASGPNGNIVHDSLPRYER